MQQIQRIWGGVSIGILRELKMWVVDGTFSWVCQETKDLHIYKFPFDQGSLMLHGFSYCSRQLFQKNIFIVTMTCMHVVMLMHVSQDFSPINSRPFKKKKNSVWCVTTSIRWKEMTRSCCLLEKTWGFEAHNLAGTIDHGFLSFSAVNRLL